MEPIDRTFRGAAFLDLDGTLLDAHSRIADANAAALRSLAEAGVARVAITGRSLFTARRVVDEGAPIDLLVVSSGAAILEWPSGRTIDERTMTPADVRRASAVLDELQLDFMVHDPHPETHRFAYRASAAPCNDFGRRLELYASYSRELSAAEARRSTATQLLAIRPEAADTARVHAELQARLPELTVIRTTSPLDHRSTWFELFPPDVSKGGAAERIRRALDLDADRCMAVGNDYNDLSLLEWCAHPFVVANAAEPLRERFPTVAHHDEAGVADAIGRALRSWGCP